MNDTDSAVKYDQNKGRWDLMPVEALEEVVQVMTYGANKYSDRNWEKGLAWGRLFAAAQRHMWAFWRGEDLDPETGLSHLAHAAASILMLLQTTKIWPNLDDRAPSLVKMSDYEEGEEDGR